VGLSEEALGEQLAAIEEVRETADIDVLAGVEANIDAEGGVSVDDDVLADLDLVIASPHSGLDGDGTERLVTAIEHPHVDVLGHPSGRPLNTRPGMTFDVERVAAAAADAGPALEININPHRLHLWGDAVQAAVAAGALVAVDTDAHSTDDLAYVRYGVHTARRGWAEEEDVLNARDLDGLRSFLD
jgi:DNA polymerase (family 10)